MKLVLSLRRRMKISCNTIVRLIEGLFFLALSLATIPFTWQAFLQHQSKDTSFKLLEVPIDGTKIATFTFCFHPPFDYNKSEVELPFHDYVLGKNSNISYYANGTWFRITSEGNKYNHNSKENLNVQLITTFFVCYKINSTASSWRGNVRVEVL